MAPSREIAPKDLLDTVWVYHAPIHREESSDPIVQPHLVSPIIHVHIVQVHMVHRGRALVVSRFSDQSRRWMVPIQYMQRSKFSSFTFLGCAKQLEWVSKGRWVVCKHRLPAGRRYLSGAWEIDRIEGIQVLFVDRIRHSYRLDFMNVVTNFRPAKTRAISLGRRLQAGQIEEVTLDEVNLSDVPTLGSVPPLPAESLLIHPMGEATPQEPGPSMWEALAEDDRVKKDEGDSNDSQ